MDNKNDVDSIIRSLNCLSFFMLFFGIFMNCRLFIAMALAFVGTLMMAISLLPKDIEIGDNLNILNNLDENGQLLISALTMLLVSFVGMSIFFYDILDNKI